MAHARQLLLAVIGLSNVALVRQHLTALGAPDLAFDGIGLCTGGPCEQRLILTRTMQEYFAKWPQEGVVDLSHEFSELIILTASRTLLGELPLSGLPWQLGWPQQAWLRIGWWQQCTS